MARRTNVRSGYGWRECNLAATFYYASSVMPSISTKDPNLIQPGTGHRNGIERIQRPQTNDQLVSDFVSPQLNAGGLQQHRAERELTTANGKSVQFPLAPRVNRAGA
jgi:hypothetical protein